MMDRIEMRVMEEAQYISDHKATVREAAQHFGVSKSTVHKDLTQRLPRLNTVLFQQTRHVLDVNKAERHLRGGIATMLKFQHMEKTGRK